MEPRRNGQLDRLRNGAKNPEMCAIEPGFSGALLAQDMVAELLETREPGDYLLFCFEHAQESNNKQCRRHMDALRETIECIRAYGITVCEYDDEHGFRIILRQ